MVELVYTLFLDDGRKQDFGTGSNPVLTTKYHSGLYGGIWRVATVALVYEIDTPALMQFEYVIF